MDKNKEKTLAKLATLLSENQITEEDLHQLVNTHSPEKKEKINLQKVLFYMGGIIIFLGITFYLSLYWLSFDKITRLLIAGISSISAFSLGYYFYKQKSQDLSQSLFFISILLFPFAIGTFLDLVGLPWYQNSTMVLESGIVVAMYLGVYYSLKAPIFLPFSFLAGTWLFMSFTNFITEGFTPIQHFYEYRFYLIGMVYVWFGHFFASSGKRYMTNFLYVAGLLMILLVGLALQGFKYNAELVWEILYIPLLVLVFYGSIRLQNMIFLTFAAIFTCIDIVKITGEYFSGSLGWPLSLIIAGIFMMVVGYITVQARSKFIVTPQ